MAQDIFDVVLEKQKAPKPEGDVFDRVIQRQADQFLATDEVPQTIPTDLYEASISRQKPKAGLIPIPRQPPESETLRLIRERNLRAMGSWSPGAYPTVKGEFAEPTMPLPKFVGVEEQPPSLAERGMLMLPGLSAIKEGIGEEGAVTFMRELANAGISLPEFFSSQLGAVSALGAANPISRPFVTGGFLVDTLVNLTKTAKSTIENWEKLSNVEKGKASAALVSQAGLAGLLGTGLKAEMKPVVRWTKDKLTPIEQPPPIPAQPPPIPPAVIQTAQTIGPATAAEVAKSGGQDASTIRSDTGQIGGPGVQPETGEGVRGPNLEQAAPRQPQPVVQRKETPQVPSLRVEDYVEPPPTEVVVKAEEFKPKIVNPVDIKAGDTIRWEPNESERRYQSSVSGIVQDIIHNTEGEIGFHIFSPTEGDPSRVVRVWANRGTVISRERATLEKPNIPRTKTGMDKETGSEVGGTIRTPKRPPTVIEIADEIAARGVDPQASYGQFVKARDLKPEISAKEWLPIYRQSLELARLKAVSEKLKPAKEVTPRAKVQEEETVTPKAAEAPPKPPDSVAEAWRRYDEAEGIDTPRDLARAIEGLIAEGKAPKGLQRSLQRYQRAVEEDFKLAGRGDVEPAEEAFLAAVEKAASKPSKLPEPTAPTPAAAPAKTTGKGEKLEWRKVPSVTGGGKAYFWNANDPATGKRNYSVVWDRPNKKWAAQEGADTLGYFDSPTKAKTFIEARASQPPPPESGKIVGMGGAVPEEFKPSGATTSGIKISAIDAQREARGLEPLSAVASRNFSKEVWNSALSEIDRDPAILDNLVAELKDNPRPLTDRDVALLLIRSREMESQWAKYTREADEARADGRLQDYEDAKKNIATFSDRMSELEEIIQPAKSETARGLAALRFMVHEDMTLAALEQQKRAAVGRQLTDAEFEHVKKLQAELASTRKAYEELETKFKETAAQRKVDELIKEAKSEPKIDKRILNYAESIVVKMEKSADAASTRLRERLARMSAGVDPTILSDAAIVASAKIARKGLDLAKLTDEMVKDFGEKIRPMMSDIWNAANELIDKTISRVPEPVKRIIKKESTPEDIKAKITEKTTRNQIPEIGPLVQKLAKHFVSQGVTTREALIDAVHEVIGDITPDWTKRDTMDAISGYGQFKQLSKDAISVQLRDLKGQMQQVAKLEDIQSKQPPLKTGLERRKPSDEERRLIKQVEEAKRRYGIVVTDPATQLTSALQARKTAMQNQISDLEYQIANKEKIVKQRTTPPTDAELESLKSKRDSLREQFDSIFGKKELTDEQKIKAAESVLERQIEEVTRQLTTGEIFPSGKKITPELQSARLAELRSKLSELKQTKYYLRESVQPSRVPEIQELNRKTAALKSVRTRLESQISDIERQLASGKKDIKERKESLSSSEIESLKAARDALKEQFTEMFPRTQEEMLAALKKQYESRIASLQQRISNKDFALKVRKEMDISKAPDVMQAKAQYEMLRKQWQRELALDRYRRQPLGVKIWETSKEMLNLPRTVMTAFDVSAVLRQGGFISLGHPYRAAQSILPMIRAFRSESAARIVEQEILNRPNAEKYKSSKLYLAPLDDIRLSAQEEIMMSRFARHIPGVRGSNRAFVTFLNKLRADSFDQMIKSLERPGKELTPAELRAISNYINVSTGRGNLGKVAGAAETLATVFFSPRLVASRFQLILGEPIYRGSAGTRAKVLEDYARFMAGLAVVYGLAGVAGGIVEVDTRSSDFGKIRFDKTRVDPLTGLAQNTTLISRLATGETKTLKGKMVAIRGKVPYGGSTSADVVARFLRTKLNPITGSALDVLSGEDVVGQRVTLGSEAQSLLTPLSFQDIYDVMVQDGFPKATALGVLSLFGMGVQQYDEKRIKR